LTLHTSAKTRGGSDALVDRCGQLAASMSPNDGCANIETAMLAIKTNCSLLLSMVRSQGDDGLN
jgi:hypothetical protein